MNDCATVEQSTILSQFFHQTMEHYKITGKRLSEVSGVSENHISDFRRGRNKTGVSTKVLWQLIEAMEEISPGSRQYFCGLMAGSKNANREDFSHHCAEIISVLEPDELAILLSTNIKTVTQAIRYLNNAERADIMSALAQCLRNEVKLNHHIHQTIHNSSGNNFAIFNGTFQSCGQ